MSITEFAARFWKLSGWSMESLMGLPPLLALLFAACLSPALAFARQRPFQNPLWRGSHWLVLTQLLFFPGVISLGVLYPASGASFFHGESTASRAYELMGLLSILLGAFWVYRMKGFRWFAFSLVAVLQVILAGAFFIAGMAVSGDWL
jgi:hypothetical protein